MAESFRVILYPGEILTRRDGSTFRVGTRDGKTELIRFCHWCNEDGPEFGGCCSMNEPPEGP